MMKRTLSYALSLALLMPTLTMMSSAVQSDEAFSNELARLIASQDSSAYFDITELTVGSKTITVDGKTQTLDTAPELLNGQVMLPLRAVAEAAGAMVDYDSENQSAIISGAYGDQIACLIGQNTAKINNQNYTMDIASYIKNGRTILSAKSVQDILELEVKREGDKITITAPYQTGRIIAWCDGQLDTSTLDAETVITDGTKGSRIKGRRRKRPLSGHICPQCRQFTGVFRGPKVAPV